MVTYSKLKLNHNYEIMKIMEELDKTIKIIKTDTEILA